MGKGQPVKTVHLTIRVPSKKKMCALELMLYSKHLHHHLRGSHWRTTTEQQCLFINCVALALLLLRNKEVPEDSHAEPQCQEVAIRE